MTSTAPDHRAPRGHRAETAGWQLIERVPLAASHEHAADVLARLPGNRFDYAGSVYVVDDDRRLLGAVRLTALLQSSARRPIVELMERPLAVHTDMDQGTTTGLAAASPPHAIMHPAQLTAGRPPALYPCTTISIKSRDACGSSLRG
jgi:hypothetical protein